MRKIVVFYFFLIVWSFSAIGQATITIGQITNAVPGTTVNVPVTVSNFNGQDIAAFSCCISYDTGVLTYQGHDNLCPALQAANFLSNATQTLICIAWFSLDTINYPNGQIFDLKFTYHSGSCVLAWDPLCSGSGITFVNGLVSGLASIGENPAYDSDQGILLSPNPASARLTIDLAQSFEPGMTVRIFNMTGQPVTDLSVLNDARSELDISMLVKGIYLVKLESMRHIINRMLVVQ